MNASGAGRAREALRRCTSLAEIAVSLHMTPKNRGPRSWHRRPPRCFACCWPAAAAASRPAALERLGYSRKAEWRSGRSSTRGGGAGGRVGGRWHTLDRAGLNVAAEAHYSCCIAPIDLALAEKGWRSDPGALVRAAIGAASHELASTVLEAIVTSDNEAAWNAAVMAAMMLPVEDSLWIVDLALAREHVPERRDKLKTSQALLHEGRWRR